MMGRPPIGRGGDVMSEGELAGALARHPADSGVLLDADELATRLEPFLKLAAFGTPYTPAQLEAAIRALAAVEAENKRLRAVEAAARAVVLWAVAQIEPLDDDNPAGARPIDICTVCGQDWPVHDVECVIGPLARAIIFNPAPEPAL